METANNLGGYPGHPGKAEGGRATADLIRCDFLAANHGDADECPCGCGCKCTNEAELAPPGSPAQLRYSRIAKVYDGEVDAPIEADLVVTNLTRYTPWRSTGNGRCRGGTFGQINMRSSTETTFRYSFVEPGTDTPLFVPFGFEFCYFDLDTGPEGTMRETVKSCGVDLNRGGYFMHGRLPPAWAASGPLPDHLCANVDTSEYIGVSSPGDGCVTAEGLREGRASDNPVDFYEVLMGTSEPAFKSTSGVCADYDTCPASVIGVMECGAARDGVTPGTPGVDCGAGVSGYRRPPGELVDAIVCPPGSPTPAGGVYPLSNLAGKAGAPYRWTMPKFICLEYPSGISHFDVTFTVGSTERDYKDGRNVMFAGLNLPRECAPLVQPLRLQSSPSASLTRMMLATGVSRRALSRLPSRRPPPIWLPRRRATPAAAPPC